ncbi:F-BAR and double SH3 domains protein 1, partial [Orchesella cincta]
QHICRNYNACFFYILVSDFTQQLSQLHEQHAVQLQMLIENYRKRNAELRKERPPCNSSMFQIWETLLQEVEIDSQAHSDISASLARQVARPLLEKTFCLKIQSRKVFAHRESFETVLSKTEALLSKAYRDYSDACMQHIQMCSNQSLAQYYEAHNAYIQQLRGTNSMLKEYHSETLPALLQVRFFFCDGAICYWSLVCCFLAEGYVISSMYLKSNLKIW